MRLCHVLCGGGKPGKKMAPGRRVREHKLWSAISPYDIVHKTKQTAHVALSAASPDFFPKLGYIYYHSYYWISPQEGKSVSKMRDSCTTRKSNQSGLKEVLKHLVHWFSKSF